MKRRQEGGACTTNVPEGDSTGCQSILPGPAPPRGRGYPEDIREPSHGLAGLMIDHGYREGLEVGGGRGRRILTGPGSAGPPETVARLVITTVTDINRMSMTDRLSLSYSGGSTARMSARSRCLSRCDAERAAIRRKVRQA